MSNKKCCVPGCTNGLDTAGNLHKFPNPDKDRQLFNTWVFKVGGDILQLENNHIFKNRRVCNDHFEPKYWCRNNRIAKGAVPTQNMPANHQFPHPKKNPERFKAWVHIVGGKLDSPADSELYKKKVICDIHFTDKDRNRNNRLNFLAVPSLHLPGKSNEVGTSEKVLPAPETVIEESSFAALKSTPFETVFLAPDRVIEERNLVTLKPTKASRSDDVCMSEKITLVPEFEHEEESLTISESNLTARSDDICMSEEVILVSEHEGSSLAVSDSTLTDTSTRKITSEHNYYQRQKKEINENNSNLILFSNKRRSDHQHQGSCIWLDQLKIARRKIKILQSNLSRSQKRNEILKSKIKNANKMSEDLLLKRLSSKMTTAAKIFTKMQYTQTEKKPSGRRFTLEEKVLSLILYKKSPKCYPLLEKFFTLPSAKSLRRLSTNVEMEPELNCSLEQNS